MTQEERINHVLAAPTSAAKQFTLCIVYRLEHTGLASCVDDMYILLLASSLPAMQAKELGVRTVIIDGPDSWCQTLPDEKLAEQFVGIDFSDAETVFDRCLAAVKKIKKAGVLCTEHLLIGDDSLGTQWLLCKC